MKQAMVQGGVHRPRSAQAWAVTVREWRRSGLKASAFCRERGLALKTFEWWRWALKSGRSRTGARQMMGSFQSPTSVVGGTRPRPAPLFVEVLPPEPPVSRAIPREDLAGVEVVLRHERRVRVAKDFDGATLRRVVAILEEA